MEFTEIYGYAIGTPEQLKDLRSAPEKENITERNWKRLARRTVAHPNYLGIYQLRQNKGYITREQNEKIIEERRERIANGRKIILHETRKRDSLNPLMIHVVYSGDRLQAQKSFPDGVGRIVLSTMEKTPDFKGKDLSVMKNLNELATKRLLEGKRFSDNPFDIRGIVEHLQTQKEKFGLTTYEFAYLAVLKNLQRKRN